MNPLFHNVTLINSRSKTADQNQSVREKKTLNPFCACKTSCVRYFITFLMSLRVICGGEVDASPATLEPSRGLIHDPAAAGDGLTPAARAAAAAAAMRRRRDDTLGGELNTSSSSIVGSASTGGSAASSCDIIAMLAPPPQQPLLCGRSRFTPARGTSAALPSTATITGLARQHAMHAQRDTVVPVLSVRLSVCLSAQCRYCV